MAENKTTSSANETKPAAEKKPAEKKPNWFVRRWRAIKKWCHELKVELKKVVWPSKKDVLHDTLVVIACVLVVGVVIWVFDALSAAVVRAPINLFQG